MTQTFRDFIGYMAFRDFLKHLTDEQKEQIINESIRMQNMQFKRFSSLENTYRTEKVSEELSLSEASQSVLHNLASYVTENRAVSVISKIGKVGTKDFQRTLDLTVQDAIEGYEKDTAVNVKDVCGDEWKAVWKMLNGLSAHIVRSEFVKHLEE